MGARYNRCTTKKLVSACQRLRKDAYRICGNANYNPAANLKKWLAIVRTYPLVLRRISAFRKASGTCLNRPRGRRFRRYRRFMNGGRTRVFGCALENNDLKRCVAGGKKLKIRWAAHVKYKAVTGLAPYIKSLDRWINEPGSLRICQTRARSLAAELKVLRAANRKLGAIAVSDAPIANAIAGLERRGLACKTKLAQLIAKRRCPRGKGGSRRLARTLRRVAKRWYTTKPGDKFKKRLHKFRLNGPTRRKYNPFKRTTFEYAPSIACVSQTYPNKKNCRIFTVTWMRKKTRRSRWSRWGFYSIGGGAMMACKNLR